MAGFKDFADGNFFTAAEVDGYLMRQTDMRFTTTANLLSQLGSGVREKGMKAWADDTETLYMYTGSGGIWTPVFSFEKTYSPVTWTGSTTNPTKGNGVEIGKYGVSGGLITAHWKFTFGTTSTGGSGTWAWTLPQAAATDYANSIVGAFMFFDTSAATFFHRQAMTIGNVGSFAAVSENGTRVGSTSPVNPVGTGDIIDIMFRYKSTALDIS